jgi:hypothetical protein
MIYRKDNGMPDYVLFEYFSAHNHEIFKGDSGKTIDVALEGVEGAQIGKKRDDPEQDIKNSQGSAKPKPKRD